MKMEYVLKKYKDGTELTATVDFDLGNRFYNYTVGHVLEERLHIMLRNVFPEIKNYVRNH
jgi:hypothetical protein